MIFRRKQPEFDVQRLRLQPGDILVITSPRRIPLETFERLKNIARDVFPGHKIAVLEAGLDMKVIQDES